MNNYGIIIENFFKYLYFVSENYENLTSDINNIHHIKATYKLKHDYITDLQKRRY